MTRITKSRLAFPVSSRPIRSFKGQGIGKGGTLRSQEDAFELEKSYWKAFNKMPQDDAIVAGPYQEESSGLECKKTCWNEARRFDDSLSLSPLEPTLQIKTLIAQSSLMCWEQRTESIRTSSR